MNPEYCEYVADLKGDVLLREIEAFYSLSTGSLGPETAVATQEENYHILNFKRTAFVSNLLHVAIGLDVDLDIDYAEVSEAVKKIDHTNMNHGWAQIGYSLINDDQHGIQNSIILDATDWLGHMTQRYRVGTQDDYYTQEQALNDDVDVLSYFLNLHGESELCWEWLVDMIVNVVSNQP